MSIHQLDILFNAALLDAQLRIHFQLQGTGISIAGLDSGNSGGHSGSGTVSAEAGIRIRPMGDRCSGESAVGSGTYLLAHDDRIRPAEPAGH